MYFKNSLFKLLKSVRTGMLSFWVHLSRKKLNFNLSEAKVTRLEGAKIIEVTLKGFVGVLSDS